jgi:hypothetical protein
MAFLLKIYNYFFQTSVLFSIDVLEKKSKEDSARIAALESRLLELSTPKQVMIGVSENSLSNHAPLPIFVGVNCNRAEFVDKVLFCDAFYVDSLQSLKQISEINLFEISHCELILDSSTNILFPGCLRLNETLTALDMDESEKNQLKEAFELAGVKLMHKDISLLA